MEDKRTAHLRAYYAALCQYNPGRYIDSLNDAPKESAIFKELIGQAISLALINPAFLERFSVTMDEVRSWSEGHASVTKNCKKKILSFIRQEIRSETGWSKHYGDHFRNIGHLRNWHL